jgi:hypothetical protein
MTKQERIDNETMRRAQSGDFSDYVKTQLQGEGGIGTAERLGVDRPIEASTPAWKSEPQNQGTAMELINQLDATPSWPELLEMKEQLVGIPAITTDEDEPRNMYQYLINEMLRSGKKPRGAQALDVSQFPENWRRTGSTTFTDPENPDLFRDLKGLYTGENLGVFNLADEPGEGILQFPQFQPGWAQGDPDKGEGLGITDWGELMEGMITGATPFKYAKMFAENTGDTLSNIGIGSIETAVKPVQWLAEQIDKINKKFTGKK